MKDQALTELLRRLENSETVDLSLPYVFNTKQLLPVLIAIGLLSLFITEAFVLVIAHYTGYNNAFFALFFGPLISLAIVTTLVWINKKSSHTRRVLLTREGFWYKDKFYLWSLVEQASSNGIDPDVGLYQFNILTTNGFVSFRVSQSTRDDLGLVLEQYAKVEPVAVTDYRFPFFQWVHKGRTFKPMNWRDNLANFLQILVRWKV